MSRAYKQFLIFRPWVALFEIYPGMAKIMCRRNLNVQILDPEWLFSGHKELFANIIPQCNVLDLQWLFSETLRLCKDCVTSPWKILNFQTLSWYYLTVIEWSPHGRVFMRFLMSPTAQNILFFAVHECLKYDTHNSFVVYIFIHFKLHYIYAY